MSRERPKPRLALRVELQAAATPERVAALARAIDRTLRGAYQALPPDSITLVVSNLRLRAEIRAWTESGVQAVQRMAGLAENPAKGAAACEVPQEAASGLVDLVQVAREGGGHILQGDSRRTVADLGGGLRAALQGIASPEPQPPVRGRIIVRSPVLRVGRLEPEGSVKARVLYDGTAREVPVAPEAVPALFDLAKEGATASLLVEVQWSAPNWPAGPLGAPSALLRILHAERFDPMPAREALASLREELGPLDDDDVLAAREDIEGG